MRKDYKNLISFLLIAFLLPFICVFAQKIIGNNSVSFVLFGIQAAAPTLSAIVTLLFNKKGNKFLKTMFGKEYLQRAILLPLIVASATMFLAKLIFCVLFKADLGLKSISVVQLVMIIWALFAEEIGWRGYLEPLLIKIGINKRIVPGIVGMIWCLWHYHYFIQGSIQVPVLLFFISCIIESYIYSFLMCTTRNNIVSAMTYHFGWNLFIHIVAINPADNSGNIFPYFIMVILETFVVFIFWSIREIKEIPVCHTAK